MSNEHSGGKRHPKRITKRQVGALKPGNLLWDGAVRGFGVRCQQTAKVYFLKTRVRGKQRWLTIGKHGSPWTVEKARERAKRVLGQVADGKDPAEVREDAAKDITVLELCNIYMAEAPFIILPKKGRPKKASSLAI